MTQDPRPFNCRFRLQAEGKPYPKSGCRACGKTVMTGLGRECSVVDAPPRAEDKAAHCEICDTPEECLAGKFPCTLSGEFAGAVSSETANALLRIVQHIASQRLSSELSADPDVEVTYDGQYVDAYDHMVRECRDHLSGVR